MVGVSHPDLAKVDSKREFEGVGETIYLDGKPFFPVPRPLGNSGYRLLVAMETRVHRH